MDRSPSNRQYRPLITKCDLDFGGRAPVVSHDTSFIYNLVLSNGFYKSHSYGPDTKV